MITLPEQSFFYDLEISDSPDWQAALNHLQELDLEVLQSARRAALEAQGIADRQIEDLVRDGSDHAQVLMLMTSALAVVSKSMQAEYDSGERYWSWRIDRNQIPHYQGDETGMMVLPLILMGSMQAAGFEFSTSA